ncbi:MAG: YihY/virulence factor BrkB family protein [Steroidobacterales bacterium]
MWPTLRERFETWLFAPAAETAGGATRLRRWARLPYAVLRDLLGGDLNLHAMGLVYATLLALIPLLALSFALLKGFGAHHLLRPLVFDFFSPMGAAAGELTERVMDFADTVRSTLVGSVGFVLLAWTLVGTLKRVEDSLNFVWRVEVPRGFARRLTEYVGLLIGGPVLLAAVIGLSRLAAKSTPVRLLSELPLLEQLYTLGVDLAPFIIASGLLMVLYMYIPNTRVRLGPALIGGAVAGVLWAAVGRWFTLFVLFSTRLTIVYAGFAIFIAALIWTYLGWLILLLGALVSFYVQYPSYLRLGLKVLRLSAADTERLGLSIMYLVGDSARSGGSRWTVASLAERLNAPGIAIARLCEELEHGGMLASSDKALLQPGRDIARIKLHDILQLARLHGSGYAVTHQGAPAAVERLGEQLEHSYRDACAGRSLLDLLET